MAEERKRLLGILLALGLLMVLQPLARADVQMMLKSTPSGDLGGVYTSPYKVQVGPSERNVLPLSCDDFLREISVGYTWTAKILALNQVSDIATHEQKFPAEPDGDPLPGPVSVTFPSTLAVQLHPAPIAYEAAGWLAYQILYGSLGNDDWGNPLKEEYSYAIWQIFTPTAYSGHLNGNQKGVVETAMHTAFTKATLGTVAEFAALTKDATAQYGYALDIYTPVPPGSSQEFLGLTALTGDVTKVPEVSALAFLIFDVLALFGGFLLVRKRTLVN